MKKNFLLTPAFVLLSASHIWAHPGHGATADGNSVAHYVTSPSHFGLWAVAIVGGLAIARALLVRAMTRKPARAGHRG